MFTKSGYPLHHIPYAEINLLNFFTLVVMKRVTCFRYFFRREDPRQPSICLRM
uniref:Uncharacterized protein n=1 Tax=Rhizophora mucronata TaxID=61149 RepID=A0A2P2JK89_RHIMU